MKEQLITISNIIIVFIFKLYAVMTANLQTLLWGKRIIVLNQHIIKESRTFKEKVTVYVNIQFSSLESVLGFPLFCGFSLDLSLLSFISVMKQDI